MYLGARSNTLASIGVTVSEITIEITMATDNDTENSRNSRPTIPPILRSQAAVTRDVVPQRLASPAPAGQAPDCR